MYGWRTRQLAVGSEYTTTKETRTTAACALAINRVATTTSLAIKGKPVPLLPRPGEGCCMVSTATKAQHSQCVGASQHTAARISARIDIDSLRCG